MAKFPLLYAVVTKDGAFDYFVVKIASHFSYNDCETEWMHDPELPPGLTLTVGLDMEESSHRFSTETQALEFIALWYKRDASYKACLELYNRYFPCRELYNRYFPATQEMGALPLSGPAPSDVTGAGG